MWGLDTLGLAKYPDLVSHWPAGYACGVFANTFGNVWPTLKRLAAGDRCPAIRIHAVWQDDHTFNAKRDMPVIRQELTRANNLKKTWPHLDIHFSPFCEHTLKGAALRTLLNICLNDAHDLTIVNSPWTGDLVDMTGVLNEVHGNAKAPKTSYNYSFDGLPCVDADVESFKATYSSAAIFFFWTSQFNGRKNPNDPTPRPLRKAWPTKELLHSVAALREPKGKCMLPNGWIWKSHADQHEVPPEPRALKPVLLSPLKLPNFKLVEDGKVLITSSSPQSPLEGKWRYYFPKYGYKINQAATALVGDEKLIGYVNPGFRENDYRNK